MGNPEVILGLRALRSENYAQVRREVEQGRTFAWEDFARVADFVALWAARDPSKAAEAFEWALSQVGPSLKGSDSEKDATKVLAVIRHGKGVGFGIYIRLREKYPTTTCTLAGFHRFVDRIRRARDLHLCWALVRQPRVAFGELGPACWHATEERCFLLSRPRYEYLSD